MKHKEIIMACICDYAGQVRGKGYLSGLGETGKPGGIGLAPTNLMITAFGDIVNSPWGSRGEILMMPVPETEVTVEFISEQATERFVLCDLQELDGSPWNCCPRNWLQRGLDILENEFGLCVNAAFEHEFHYSGVPKRLGNAYGLDAMRLQGMFANTVVNALQTNAIEPEMFMPEYGPQQYEVTCSPAIGLAAADRAVRLREIVRSVARNFGYKATFAPVMGVGMVGNGVHLHYSLVDKSGKPKTYNPDAPHCLDSDAACFTAGILRAMPEFIALTAPSAVSYERLQPHRWSAAYNNLADKDREAGVRICPLPKLPDTDPHARFNLEYRAADATANPYLVLGALVWAGIDGLKSKLKLPETMLGDPGVLPEEELQARGIQRLPTSLEKALDMLEQSERLKAWMGNEFHNAYLVNKRSELSLLDGLDPDEQVRRYAECY